MRSPPRPGSRGVRWARRWHGRAGAWSRRTKREKRVNMSHVDDGTLHAYLDGELSPPETQTVETHVVQCPACRTRLEEDAPGTRVARVPPRPREATGTVLVAGTAAPRLGGDGRPGTRHRDLPRRTQRHPPRAHGRAPGRPRESDHAERPRAR
ncbi:MAG: hypothetical protein DMD67_06720 [Gemmatimonadetes bacterium]|nr:MAG: hypothetical protein DMD67_06720 [Gemmatimonadota bacterium]